MNRPTNVILLVYDSVRADSIGPEQTPTLWKLASQGIQFEQTFASAPWTAPATNALLTGIYPHRIEGAFTWGEAFAPGKTTLFHRFAEANYRTGAFVFDPDFLFRQLPEAGTPERADDPPAMLDWIRRNHKQPFFLYLHSWSTHVPYGLSPESIRGRERELHQKAVHEVSESEIRPLLSLLEHLDILENTLLLFTSDHGEDWSVLESPRSQHWKAFDLHGRTLSQEVLQVPLILFSRGIDQKGQVHRARVRAVDIAPDILHRVNLPPLPEADGVPIFTEDPIDRPALACTNATPDSPETWPQHPTLWTLFENRFQLLVDTINGRQLLFDRSSTTPVLEDVSLAFPLRVQEMYEQIRKEQGRSVLSGPPVTSDQIAQRLKHLGYL